MDEADGREPADAFLLRPGADLCRPQSTSAFPESDGADGDDGIAQQQRPSAPSLASATAALLCPAPLLAVLSGASDLSLGQSAALSAPQRSADPAEFARAVMAAAGLSAVQSDSARHYDDRSLRPHSAATPSHWCGALGALSESQRSALRSWPRLTVLSV